MNPLSNKKYCFHCKEYQDIDANDKGTHGYMIGYKLKDVEDAVKWCLYWKDKTMKEFFIKNDKYYNQWIEFFAHTGSKDEYAVFERFLIKIAFGNIKTR